MSKTHKVVIQKFDNVGRPLARTTHRVTSASGLKRLKDRVMSVSAYPGSYLPTGGYIYMSIDSVEELGGFRSRFGDWYIPIAGDDSINVYELGT